MNFEFGEEQELLREQARGFQRTTARPPLFARFWMVMRITMHSCGKKSLRWAGQQP